MTLHAPRLACGHVMRAHVGAPTHRGGRVREVARMRRTVLSFLTVSTASALCIGGAFLGTSPAGASDIAVIDTLGAATPTTMFSIFGSGGAAILDSQFVGPQFTLSEETVITEIGGFVNNRTSTLPFTVQVRPSLGGAPDPSTVVATFVLSNDADPLVVSFESVMTSLTLEPGTYFALFAPEDADQGFLLAGASSPFDYQAGVTTLGFLDPTTGTSSASDQFGAVRILGHTAAQISIDIRPDSSTNSIKLSSLGKITVAILSNSSFDATTVDLDSVCFGDAEAPAERDCTAAHSSLEDVNSDGRPDLLLLFEIKQTGIDAGDTQACLAGRTLSGLDVEGCDSIKTL
jgi:hypothetical protein